MRETYKVGSTFPVFILANSRGNVIYRWTGYVGSHPFILSLNKAKLETLTVEERKKKFQIKPEYREAIFLAQYSADTREFLDAITYYKSAGSLGNGNRDFSYEIYKNTANAIWNDMAPFDKIFPAADAVLNSKRNPPSDIAGMATIMIRLARKMNQTGKIASYIQAGIDAAKESRNPKDAGNLASLQADYALYADSDTSGALEIRKQGLGPDWKRKPDKFYEFADWCAERKIDLEEAEFYAREAVKLAQDGQFKGKVLNTLAEICYARDNIDEAVSLMERALEQDPANEAYEKTYSQYLMESAK